MGDRQAAQSSEKGMSLAVVPPSLRGKKAGGTHTAGGANVLIIQGPEVILTLMLGGRGPGAVHYGSPTDEGGFGKCLISRGRSP